MKVMKLTKRTESKIDLARSLLSIYCLLANKKVPDTELLILSYLMVYGVKKQTKELIIRSQILKSKGSLENSLSKLRSLGLLIKREDEGTRLIPDLDFSIESKMGLIIKLDNA